MVFACSTALASPRGKWRKPIGRFRKPPMRRFTKIYALRLSRRDGMVRAMKNLLLGQFLKSRLGQAAQPVEQCADATVQAIMAQTRRELATFASEQMGAQAFVGQFDKGRNDPVDRSGFRKLVESASDAVMVIDPRPGLHIIDINQAYAAATLTERGQAAGGKLFDVFPDNPGDPDADGVSNLYESIQRAAQSGRPHMMAIQRYDVRDASGAFVERLWQPINTPIFDDKGRLIYVLHEANQLRRRPR
jgi:PAS domain-containing protein